MLDRVRNGQGIDVQYVESTDIHEQDNMEEVVGRIGVVPNAINQKRLRLRHEISSSYQRRNGKRQRATNDSDYAQNNIRTKTCRFCRRSGHTFNHCPKIEEYNSPPIVSRPTRDELVSNLERTGYYITHECSTEEKRIIADTLPIHSRGIVIHTKKRNIDGSIFFEATVLVDGGEKHTIYQMYPFSKGAISRFINKSTKNVVVCLLKIQNETDLATGSNIDTTALSQSSFLSGLSQGSYYGDYNPVASLTNTATGSAICYSQTSTNDGYIDRIGFGNGVGDI